MRAQVAWIISPHASTRQLIGLNLNKRGFHVVEASASDDVPPSDPQPQIIILDIDPHNGTDWETAPLLRQDSTLQRVPLILLLSEAPTLHRLGSLDPVHWISKPVDIQALLKSVEACLPQPNRRQTVEKSQTSFADQVRAIPGGEHMYMCYSCGTCVSSCMIQLTGEVTYNPRRLIQKVINGLEQEAFEDRTTWLCSACDLCYPACPQKIHVSGVMSAIKELAIQSEAPTQISTASVNERTCVACGMCVDVCPYEAISLVDKEIAGHSYTFASVDAERCMACGLCAASCRSSSIELVDEFASEAVMDNLWQWMHATAPAPISIESIFEWATEPSDIAK